MKWEETNVGKIVESQVAEIKDFPKVVMFFSDLKDREYNESVLQACQFPYAFVGLSNPEESDSGDNYLFVYLVKMTEEMYEVYFNKLFFAVFKSSYFRIYHDGDCIGAFGKTPTVPPPGN